MGKRKTEIKKDIATEAIKPSLEDLSPELKAAVEKNTEELAEKYDGKYYIFIHYPITDTKMIVSPKSFVPYVDTAGNQRRDERPPVYATFKGGIFRMTETFCLPHGIDIEQMAELFKGHPSFNNGMYFYEAWDKKPDKNGKLWMDRVKKAQKDGGVRTVVGVSTGARASGD